jgi:hypothetical protein
MIIQSTLPGKPHFVIEQPDHTKTCGQLARAFGNEQFAAPEPRDLVVYIVEHHDQGWEPVDALREQSPATGMPHHLTQTPLPYLIRTSQGSPDFNEQQHAYCGLLSSMHTYGLFNGRYGLSDFVFIEKISPEHQAATQEMLENELTRQTRLKAQLAADPATAAWVEESALFINYKLLQFFDTLALYFHMTHAEARSESKFLNVPDGRGGNHTLTITPRPDGAYALAPFPFSGDSLEINVEGRYIAPQPPGADFNPIFENTPKEKQVYRLVRA